MRWERMRMNGRRTDAADRSEEDMRGKGEKERREWNLFWN